MKRIGFRLLVAVTAIGLACEHDFGVLPPPLATVTGDPWDCSNLNRLSRSNTLFQSKWDCETDVVVFYTSTNGGSFGSAIGTAISRWNAIFAAYDLPRLAGTAYGPPNPSNSPKLTFHPIANGGGWCANYPDVWQQPVGSTSCPQWNTARVTNLPDLITHELGHGIGFAHPDEGNAATQDCIMHVPASGSFNVTPCHHEFQSVYWAYSLRNTEPTLLEELTDPTPVISPTSVTIRPDSLATFTVSAGATWSIANSAVASLYSTTTTSATVRGGLNEGSTTLTATAIATPTVIWPTRISNPATITVARPPAATVTIDPATVDLVGPTDVTLIATVTDVDGVVRPDIPLTWTVSDTSRVYFVPSGQSAWVSAKRNGWVTITATAPNGVLGTATVYIEGCKIRCLA